MVRGIYTSSSGMVAEMHRLDAISNNLANVDTTGYKKETSVQKAFPEMLLKRINDDGVYKFPFGSIETAPIVGKLGTGVELNELYTVFSQGSLKETGNDFDFSLEGKGFFCIETPEGERYTRNGSFILGKEGMLLTKDGYPVLGENGPIQIKQNNFIVDSLGRIYENSIYSGDPERMVSMLENQWEDTQLVDTLKIVDFERDRYIKKQGDSMYIDTLESGKAEITDIENKPRVKQGFIETANVNPVIEMVKMIEVNRAYEANQKMIQTHDGLSAKLINEAVRI